MLSPRSVISRYPSRGRASITVSKGRTPAIGNTPLPVTGTVGLTSGTAVTIANTDVNPVLVREVGRGTPFQVAKVAAAQSGDIDFGTVPEGQRWIIQHASVQYRNTNALLESMALTKDTGVQGEPFRFDFLIPNRIDSSTFVASGQTMFIADAGEKVLILLNGYGGSGTSQLEGFISGVIVPSP